MVRVHVVRACTLETDHAFCKLPRMTWQSSIGRSSNRRACRASDCDPQRISWSGQTGKMTIVTENGVVSTNPHLGIEGYIPHWATCPKANEFKK